MGQFRHCHRVVSGNQHVPVHLQWHSVELPLPQHIGQGFAVSNPVHGEIHGGTFFLGGQQAPVGKQHILGPSGHMAQQVPCHPAGILRILGGQQHFPGLQVKVRQLFYHRSAPSCSGSTAFTAAMPTSIMESSGSLVVKYWNHIPGAVSTRLRALSCRPTQRLHS